MSYKKCKCCNKIMHVYPSEINKKVFCSRKCYSEYGKTTFVCKVCGISKKINKCDTRIFCSKKCKKKHDKQKWYKENKCIICYKKFFPVSSKAIRKTCSKKCQYELNGKVRRGNKWKMSIEGKQKISIGRKHFLSKKVNLEKHAQNTKDSWNNLSTRKSRLTEKRNDKISKTQRKQFASGERVNAPIYKIRNYYNNINFRSTWEVRFAEWCDIHNIKYKYESKECRVLMENGRTYIIDFFLPEKNMFVEVKGWFKKYDEYKLNQAVKQKYNIIIIDKNNIDDINLNCFWIDIKNKFRNYLFYTNSEIKV